MEKEIKIAYKLYQCRDTAKRLYGEKYKAKIDEYQNVIKDFMERRNISNPLEVVMLIVDVIKDDPDNGIYTMNLMAAYVEMIEPSET